MVEMWGQCVYVQWMRSCFNQQPCFYWPSAHSLLVHEISTAKHFDDVLPDVYGKLYLPMMGKALCREFWIKSLLKSRCLFNCWEKSIYAYLLTASIFNLALKSRLVMHILSYIDNQSKPLCVVKIPKFLLLLDYKYQQQLYGKNIQ